MPNVFLSPSTQDYNPYYDNSGSEEYYMNLIADKMERYLDEAGITYGRNDKTKRAGQAARDSNKDSYGLHLAIHSNAAAPQNAGKQQGVDVYYFAGSERGKRDAEIIAENFKEIYPFDFPIRTLPNTSFVELNSTRAPAVLIEVAYHDNPEDAEWIKNNIDLIAANLAKSVEQISGANTAFNKTATVKTGGGRLNVRKKPAYGAEILYRINDGDTVEVMGMSDGWCSVSKDGKKGFADGKYIDLS